MPRSFTARLSGKFMVFTRVWKFVSAAVLMVALSATPTLIVPQDASAGELFRSARRSQTRRVKSSTNAARRLSSSRSQNDVATLKSSSPYDYRIIKARNDNARYEEKLAKWQYKADQTQRKQTIKAQKERQKRQEKAAKLQAKERDKALRQKEKDERDKARATSKSEPKKGLLGGSSTETSTPAARAKGEMFTSPSAEKDGEPKRRTFWQRIKDWLFGPATPPQTRSRAQKRYANTKPAPVESIEVQDRS
jgi:hypothetical protein